MGEVVDGGHRALAVLAAHPGRRALPRQAVAHDTLVVERAERKDAPLQPLLTRAADEVALGALSNLPGRDGEAHDASGCNMGGGLLIS